MSFRKYGGLQFSSKHNAVASNYNTINKLQVSEDVGQPNSHILVESELWCHSNVDISGNLRVNGTSILNGDVSCYSNVDISGNLMVNGTSSMYKPLTMTSTNPADRTINSTFYQLIDYTTGINYGDGMYITSDLSGNDPVWNFNINRPNGAMNFVSLDASLNQKTLLQLLTTKVNLYAETQIQQDLLIGQKPALVCNNSTNPYKTAIGLFSNLAKDNYGPNVENNYVGLIATDNNGITGPPLIVKTHDGIANGMYLGLKTAYFGYGGSSSTPSNKIYFDASINKTILMSETNCPELGGAYTAVPYTDSSNKIATTAWVQGIYTSGVITGNISVTGSVTASSFNTTSDYRIKKNVKILDDSHNIDELKPVTYYNTKTGKQDIGLIAHEVQEIFPFLVQGEKDGESLQNINYIGLIGILIKEIQELKIEQKSLREKLEQSIK